MKHAHRSRIGEVGDGPTRKLGHLTYVLRPRVNARVMDAVYAIGVSGRLSADAGGSALPEEEGEAGVAASGFTAGVGTDSDKLLETGGR